MTDPKGPLPFNREKFLFRLLAGIFIWQAVIFTYGLIACLNLGGIKECPDIGERYENTVNVMVATTLALLGTSTIIGSQRKASEDNSAKPTAPPKGRPLGKP